MYVRTSFIYSIIHSILHSSALSETFAVAGFRTGGNDTETHPNNVPMSR